MVVTGNSSSLEQLPLLLLLLLQLNLHAVHKDYSWMGWTGAAIRECGEFVGTR
jgi:hypothetical protein